MPTGYTHIVPEGATFEQFVWYCARAFSPLASMRDEPSDAEIPMEIKPEGYYLESYEDAKMRLDKLFRMTKAEIAAEVKRVNQEAVAQWTKDQEKYREIEKRYRDMLAKVEGWDPPTPDHVNLKAFMLNQLRDSLNYDVHYSEKPLPVKEEEWYLRQMNDARGSVEYYREHFEKEVSRAKQKTEWLQTLRKSVPYKIWKRK